MTLLMTSIGTCVVGLFLFGFYWYVNIFPETLFGKEQKFKRLLKRYEKKKGYPYDEKRLFH